MSTTIGAHVAVLAVGATGHLLPVLDVITELRERGHRVTCFVPDVAAPAASRAGADVVTYESTLVARPSSTPPSDFAVWLPFVLLAEAAAVVPQVIPVLGRDVPDVLLYDRAAHPAGRALAQLLDRPAVALFPSFAQGPAWSLAAATGQTSVLDPAHPAFTPLQDQLDQFSARWGVERSTVRDLAEARERRSVAFLPRWFQWNGDEFGTDHHFVGPCLGSRLGTGPARHERLVYVSAGTAAAEPEAVRSLVRSAATAAPNHRVLVSTGGFPVATLGTVPDRVEAHEHVDQLAALAQADLFVTHAGMGSVMEALWFAVPMVCAPRTSEQHLVAARVEALGLGVNLPDGGAPSGDEGVARMRDLAHDPTMRERLGAASAKVRAAGGRRAAADAVETALASDRDEVGA
ncbi:nucleotide disphospho-sugar-binding domain-containing protein [Micromonospora sp. NPDC049175]|uniref:nucleotide disphospho-sugar-binding domain-containing protein n=1 Tax=Micromonospora sp. NPDC049175 TaxID=3364266 RepID=UPI00371859F6